MKRFYKFLMSMVMAMALTVPWQTQAQATLTVANGTVTNEYVPIYGYYGDAYLRADFVYPTSMIGAMAGGSITQMTFYSEDASVSLSSNFKVYLTEVSSATLSSFTSATGLTQVYNGTVTISGSQMTVTFATPYVYQGGNLLVRVESTTTGNYVHTYWYGISSTGSSVQGYDYDSPSGIDATSRDFLPKTTFGYTPAGDDFCFPPTGVTAQVTGSDVNVSWTDTNASSWNIVWGVGNFNPDTVVINSASSSTTSYQIAGLDEGLYTVYVQADCGDTVSSWSAAPQFMVGGCIITIDAIDSYGDGWNDGSLAVMQDSAIVQTVGLSSGTQQTYLVPVFGSSPVSFVWTSGNYDDEVTINIYDGGGAMLFTVTDPSAGTIYTMSDPCPTCLGVANLHTSYVSTDSITVGWTPRGQEGEWLLYLNDSLVASVTDTIYTFENLLASSVYSLGVSAVCSSDDTSGIVPISQRTACGTISALPFVQDFENCPTGSSVQFDPCWSIYNTTSTSYNYPYVASADGGKYLNMYLYNSSNMNGQYGYAMMPMFGDELDDVDMEVSFDIWGSSTSTYGRGVIVALFDTSGTAANPVYDTVTIIIPTATSMATATTEYVSLVGHETAGKRLGFFFKNQQASATGSYFYTYIDNVNLHVAPDCMVPQNLVANYIGTDTLDLSWEGTGSSWLVEYRVSGSTAWTGVEVSDTNVVLASLNASTPYDIRVRTLCGGDTSFALTGNFRTACGAISSLPYVMDFENCPTGSTVKFDPCWSIYNNYSTTSKYPYVSTASNNKYLYMYLYGSNMNSMYGYAMMPVMGEELDDVDMEVSFNIWRNSTSTYGRGVIVALFNANDTTANPIYDTVAIIVPTATSLATATTEYVSLVGHNTAGKRLGFFFKNQVTSATGSYYYTYIDNVNLHVAPNCLVPQNLTADNITADTLELSWTGTSDAYYVEYRAAADTTWTGVDVSDNSVVLEPLSANTQYEIRVRGVCDGDTSYALLGSFRTNCGAITTLPWTENFNGMSTTSSATAIPCWSYIGTGGYVNIQTTGAHSGNCVRFYPNGDSGNDHVLVLPPFDTVTSGLEMTFWTRPESSSSSGSLSVGYVTNPASAASFVEVLNVPMTMGTTNMQYEVTFAGAPAGSRIAMRHNVSSTAWYWFVDDIDVHAAPTCLHPSVLAITNTTDSEIGFSFGGEEGATFRIYLKDTTGTVLDSIDTTATSYSFTGLTPSTFYRISVATICGTELSEFVTVSGRTTAVINAVTVPYITGFEDATLDTAWTLVNGTNTNKWVFGSAAHSSGSRALYISDNNGTANEYTITSAASNVSVYKAFRTTAAGQYAISFDWKAQGESCCDYLRAFLVPASVDIVAGQNGIGTTGAPTGWTAIDGGNKLNAVSDWQNVVYFFDVAGSGLYKVVFFWHNDGSLGTNPPAAIDNFSFVQVTCPRPTALTLDTISYDSMAFHWTAGGSETSWEVTVGNLAPVVVNTNSYAVNGLLPNTSYNVRVRGICGAGDSSLYSSANFTTVCGPNPLPFFRDFDNLAYDYFAEDCWKTGNTANQAQDSYNNWPYIISFTGTTDDKLLFLNHGAYVYLPQMGAPLNQLELTFDFSSSHDSSVLYIGYVTNPNMPYSSAVIMDTIYHGNYATPEEFRGRVEYSMSAYPDTAARLVIASDVTGTDHWIGINELTIAYPPTCGHVENISYTSANSTSATLTWTASANGTPQSYVVEYGPRLFTPGTGTIATTTTNSITLTGLQPMTPYQAYIVTNCGAGDSSVATMPFEFSSACGDMVIPTDTIGFEEYMLSGRSATGLLPNCWTIDSTSIIYSEDSVAAMIYGMDDNSSMVLLMNDQSFLAMPSSPVDLDTLQISFDFTAQQNAALVVGSVSSQAPGFAASFVPVDTLRFADNGRATVYFAGYTGSNRYIAFQNIALDTNNYAQVAIDNIAIAYAPSCYPVTHTEVIMAGENNITVDWTDVVSAGNWTIEYGPQGFVPGAGTTMNVTTHPVNITGLSSTTTYDIYIVPVCSASDHGDTTHITASTTCGVISTFPWVEGFENDIVLECWTQEGNGQWSIGTGDYSTTTGSHSGTSNLKITHATTGNVTKIISPVLALSGSNATLTFWHVQRSWAGDIDELRVYYRTSMTDSWHQLAVYTSAIASWTQDSLMLPDVSSTYQIAFEMTDNYGYGVAIDDITVTGAGAAVGCEAPVIDSVTATETTVTVQFTAPDIVQVAIAETWNDNMTGTTESGTSHTFAGLTAGTTYTVGVRTLCESGDMSEWTLQTITTDEHPCYAPTNLTITSVTLNGGTVSWTVGEEGQNVFEVNVHNNTYDSTFTVNGATTLTLTGLYSETDYEVKVRAVCGTDNYSDWSNTVVLTPSTCAMPTDVTSSNVTSNSAKISWTGSADSYEVRYGVDITTSGGQLVTVNATEVVLSDLDEETQYDVYVRAVCDGATSNWTAKYQFTTTAGGTEGINDVYGSEVVLYPNPASTQVTLAGLETGATVNVVDLNGRSCGQWLATGESMTIDLTGYAQGAYFVRIVGEQGTAVRKLIVK